MSPICESHGEIKERLIDIKEVLDKHTQSGEQRWEAIRNLEKFKVSWNTFTWILTGILAAWMGVNGFMWNRVEKMEAKIIGQIETSDKEDSTKRAETWRRLGSVSDSMQELKWRFDTHLQYHTPKANK